MSFLIGHMASSSAWPRFLMSRKWQRIIGYPSDCHNVVVSETKLNTYDDWETIEVPKGEKDGLFNLSSMRNAIRHYAQSNGFDWFMIMESDFIALRWPTKIPDFWSIPFAAYDNPDSTTFQDITIQNEGIPREGRAWEILGHRPLIPVHCVIVSKNAYANATWDERFEGCGYDDWDFNDKMHKECGQFSKSDAFLVHRWHPGTGASPRPENLVLYESKWGPVKFTAI